jgi:hypothetical protein
MPKMKQPTRVCVQVPADMVEGANAIAAVGDTNVSEEVRRALRRHVTAERRRLGLAR